MAGASTQDFRVFGMNMWQQVAVALIAGIAVGLWLKEDAASLQVLGTIFMKLIKMVVAPLIFFALIAGITSLTESHHVKGIALKGIPAYMLTALMSVMAGLFLGSVFQPGLGVTIPADLQPVQTPTAPPTIKEFLLGLIPTNIVGALATDHYLQIVIFAIFTGIVMNNISGSTDKVKELNQQMAHIVFKMIEWIVRLAPLAVFGFLAAMVGTTGIDVIKSLLQLVVLVIAACFLQMMFFGVLIMVFGRLNPIPFYKKMITTQVMAFSTSSSKATLTTAMRELQDKLGVSMPTSNFMMPLGACINMDGTAIYLGIAATFFAQIYGVDLDMFDYLTLMLTCTLGSIGAAGIPSGSIIFMGMVLSSVGIPMEGIALILGVDRVLDMFRTTVNITGDAAITMIVDHSEGQLNKELYYKPISEM
jgi:Na+/H+-dicarboxylate symporter